MRKIKDKTKYALIITLAMLVLGIIFIIIGIMGGSSINPLLIVGIVLMPSSAIPILAAFAPDMMEYLFGGMFGSSEPKRRCPKCGRSIPEDAVVCPYCANDFN